MPGEREQHSREFELKGMAAVFIEATPPSARIPGQAKGDGTASTS
ncbi:MAG TPA: hypothetical protein VLT16_18560 [Candidatus Limnocylindrales bacterium]|nr:hypothetical protein [Candidatus Limnocylindrales bacterium]